MDRPKISRDLRSLYRPNTARSLSNNSSCEICARTTLLYLFAIFQLQLETSTTLKVVLSRLRSWELGVDCFPPFVVMSERSNNCSRSLRLRIPSFFIISSWSVDSSRSSSSVALTPPLTCLPLNLPVHNDKNVKLFVYPPEMLPLVNFQKETTHFSS